LLTRAKDLGIKSSNAQVAKLTKLPKVHSTTPRRKTCSKEVSTIKEVSNMKGVTTRSKG
jgi:hypothetical protein